MSNLIEKHIHPVSGLVTETFPDEQKVFDKDGVLVANILPNGKDLLAVEPLPDVVEPEAETGGEAETVGEVANPATNPDVKNWSPETDAAFQIDPVPVTETAEPSYESVEVNHQD